MVLIFSIEGGESNTEVNFFNELNRLASNAKKSFLIKDQTFTHIRMHESKTNIKQINGFMDSFIADVILDDISKITDIVIVHDWDRSDQIDPINFTYEMIISKLEKSIPDANIMRIHTTDVVDVKYGNFEGWLYFSLFSTKLDKSNWSTEIPLKSLETLKNIKMNNPLNSIFVKKKIFLYEEETFEKMFTQWIVHLKKHNSPYQPLFERIWEIIST